MEQTHVIEMQEKHKKTSIFNQDIKNGVIFIIIYLFMLVFVKLESFG